MKRDRPESVLQWLKSGPDLEELSSRYPNEWLKVQQELAAIFDRGQADELQAYLERRSLQPARRAGVSGDALASELVRQRMAQLAIKRSCLRMATGVTSGKVRFNLLNGFIAQKLLFASGFERKPVSMFWFRLIWPLLWQRKLLMPLVESKGIYCFYSRQLIERLAGLIGSRPCIEIAAGDGTLSRFLKDRGVNIVASDDRSWKRELPYPDAVEQLDAKQALARHVPKVVICSWPPARNDFERQVFVTPGVELYIVISSRHEFASGNWDDYRRQSDFSLEQDRSLSALVLPPELEAAVYLFRRKVAD